MPHLLVHPSPAPHRSALTYHFQILHISRLGVLGMSVHLWLIHRCSPDPRLPGRLAAAGTRGSRHKTVTPSARGPRRVRGVDL
ncbi:hypothetical protein E2C01_097552 [Portunus trituberculatus]|uniref:Uncharacterized protein n=1 Tax=Portunus trituberculatus TaxID=210409 RepID=A0A5B7K9X5_PORTR|nr:hypothetical protein [Portunus trituberculatus]